MSASGINNLSADEVGNLGLHTNLFVGCIPNRCPVAEQATCKEVRYHQLAARKPFITCSNTLRNMFLEARTQIQPVPFFMCSLGLHLLLLGLH